MVEQTEKNNDTKKFPFRLVLIFIGVSLVSGLIGLCVGLSKGRTPLEGFLRWFSIPFFWGSLPATLELLFWHFGINIGEKESACLVSYCVGFIGCILFVSKYLPEATAFQHIVVFLFFFSLSYYVYFRIVRDKKRGVDSEHPVFSSAQEQAFNVSKTVLVITCIFMVSYFLDGYFYNRLEDYTDYHEVHEVMEYYDDIEIEDYVCGYVRSSMSINEVLDRCFDDSEISEFVNDYALRHLW